MSERFKPWIKDQIPQLMKDVEELVDLLRD
jgi:hypothetical protein